MIDWYLLALISALFSATAAIVQKKILFKEKAINFATTLAIFNLILAIPFFFFIDFGTINLTNISVLFFKSILGAGAFLFVMRGIRSLELSSALPLLVLTPGLVAIFSFIILRETLNYQEIIGMVLLLVGTYILQLKEKQKIFDPFKSLTKKGYINITIALILFTTTSILDKALLKKFGLPVNAFMGFQHLFFAIIFFIFLISLKESKNLRNTIKNSWTWILIVSTVTIIYRWTQILAVKEAPVALVLSMKRISVLFAVIIGGRIFKEKELWKKIICTIIILAGALLIINS